MDEFFQDWDLGSLPSDSDDDAESESATQSHNDNRTQQPDEFRMQQPETAEWFAAAEDPSATPEHCCLSPEDPVVAAEPGGPSPEQSARSHSPAEYGSLDGLWLSYTEAMLSPGPAGPEPEAWQRSPVSDHATAAAIDSMGPDGRVQLAQSITQLRDTVLAPAAAASTRGDSNGVGNPEDSAGTSAAVGLHRCVAKTGVLLVREEAPSASEPSGTAVSSAPAAPATDSTAALEDAAVSYCRQTANLAFGPGDGWPESVEGWPVEAAVHAVLLAFYEAEAPVFATDEKVERVVSSYQRKASKRGVAGQGWQGLLWEGFTCQGQMDPRVHHCHEVAAAPSPPKTAPTAPTLARLPDMPTAEKCEALFDRWDVNGNGGLSLAEIDKAVAELYPEFDHKPVLMRAFKAADASGDGFIKCREFKRLLHFLGYFNDLWHKFEEVDTDGDKKMSIEEFRVAAALVGHGGMSAGQVASEFSRMEDNNCGVILFDEFCVWAAHMHLGAETAGKVDNPSAHDALESLTSMQRVSVAAAPAASFGTAATPDADGAAATDVAAAATDDDDDWDLGSFPSNDGERESSASSAESQPVQASEEYRPGRTHPGQSPECHASDVGQEDTEPHTGSPGVASTFPALRSVHSPGPSAGASAAPRRGTRRLRKKQPGLGLNTAAAAISGRGASAWELLGLQEGELVGCARASELLRAALELQRSMWSPGLHAEAVRHAVAERFWRAECAHDELAAKCARAPKVAGADAVAEPCYGERRRRRAGPRGALVASRRARFLGSDKAAIGRYGERAPHRGLQSQSLRHVLHWQELHSLDQLIADEAARERDGIPFFV